MMATDDMASSRAAIQAAGASCLELPAGAVVHAAAQEQMHPYPQPMTPHEAGRQLQPPSSPAPSSSAAYSMPLYSPSQGSPCGSPFSSSRYAPSPGAAASSPRFMRASPVPSPSGAVPMSPFRGSTRGGPFLAGYQSPGVGPQSPGPRSPGFGFSALSPGGAIRQNAASLGIPLDLRYGHDVGVPIPVRTSSGMVVAPSPVVARTGLGDMMQGGLLPQQLHFGLPPLPGSSAAPGQPSAAIRAIVTPLRSGVRGGA
eukprot:TRINITY_DN17812_c0_g1_i1.p1 TRINITY_DN17812_c0_g1~~TRINITY_DN17812_c0_g1_i1.p1  ORF type:complete len:256 (+),score=23.98 TRINITY_DN17812_c0_g1_i1:175-942(+)